MKRILFICLFLNMVGFSQNLPSRVFSSCDTNSLSILLETKSIPSINLCIDVSCFNFNQAQFYTKSDKLKLKLVGDDLILTVVSDTSNYLRETIIVDFEGNEVELEVIIFAKKSTLKLSTTLDLLKNVTSIRSNFNSENQFTVCEINDLSSLNRCVVSPFETYNLRVGAVHICR